jgi:transcription antitermination factor NusG
MAVSFTLVGKDNSGPEKPSSGENTRWYVFYTAPRAEKVAYNQLIRLDYEAFLPMMRSMHIWKNRQKKWIEEVLFPSYIFVNTHSCHLYRIVSMPKITACISCGGKPSVISHNEIEAIKKVLHNNENMFVQSAIFHEGERVRVTRGPLAGCEGVLVKQKGKTHFGIQLEVINHTLLVDIDTSFLDVV